MITQPMIGKDMFMRCHPLSTANNTLKLVTGNETEPRLNFR